MAFTMGFTLAKDSAGNAIPGGLLSADIAGGGVGPTLPFHSLIDGVAGVNRIAIDSSSRMAVLAAIASAGIASGAFASGSIASGAFASGAVASGAFASGALASGSVASGALASGSIAAGAMVDLLTMRGTKAPGTAAANSILGGGVYTQAGVTLTDGQQAALQFSSSGALLVSGSSGATEYTEDAAAAANPVGPMTMLRRFDTPANTTVSADGDNFAWQGNAYGAGYVIGMDKFGTLTDYTVGSEIQGDLAHDAAFTGSNPIVFGGYAKAAAPTNVSADGDVVNAWFGLNGAQMVNLTAAGALIPGDATSGLRVGGGVAHDGADSGNPNKIGGRARSSEIAAVASDDRVDAIFDLVGKQIVLPYANPENFVSGAITSAMTGTTSTSLVAAPAAGLRNYLTTIICSNAHATVGTDIIIQDGSGGTTLLTIPAAAVYGGAAITLPTPLRQPTTATAIYCANVTTGASTKVSAVGYKGA